MSSIFTYYDKYYSKDYYYLYTMSIYHFIIIIYTYLFKVELHTKTFFVLSWDISNISINYLSTFTLKNIFFISIIFFVDLIFLIILKSEFKSLNLNYKKIISIEGLILFISLSHPIIRNIMYFLSLNTLQITLTYKIIKYIPFGKFVFLTGAYISLIRITIYPLIQLYYISQIPIQ